MCVSVYVIDGEGNGMAFPAGGPHLPATLRSRTPTVPTNFGFGGACGRRPSSHSFRCSTRKWPPPAGMAAKKLRHQGPLSLFCDRLWSNRMPLLQQRNKPPSIARPALEPFFPTGKVCHLPMCVYSPRNLEFMKRLCECMS